MTNKVALLFFFFLLVKTESLVNNATKVYDAVETTEAVTRGDSSKENKERFPVKSAMNAPSVYLEDVFYNLKNQKWKKDQELCRNQTLQMLAGLQNFSLWAAWEWDSISSEPMGLLYGNQLQLGNFDECLNAPWRSTHPHLKTQYCLANIQLTKRNATKSKKITSNTVDPYSSIFDYLLRHRLFGSDITQLTWGVCVPSSCDAASVERLTRVLLARSHLGTTGIVPQITVPEDCQDTVRNTDYDSLFYSFVTVAVILLLICIVCTVLNSYNREDDVSLKSDVVKSFCLSSNGKSLMKMSSSGTEVLYGIRAISMYFVVLDHLMGMRNAGPVSDGVELDQKAKTFMGMVLLHNDLLVDSYFFLSAFLLIGGLLKQHELRKSFNPILLLLRRYIRLVVCFAVVIFYVVAVYPYTGSGPLWPLAVQSEKDPCLENWWLALLMLNNYVNTDNSCLVISWYIPCDFHFFVVTLFLFWLYERLPRPTLVMATTIAVAGLVIPGVINYVYDLPPIQVFDRAFIMNPRDNFQFKTTYIPSHTRVGAYVVGLIAGVFYHKLANQDRKLSKKWSSIGACAALAIMAATMMMGYSFYSRDYHPLEGAVYATLQRPAWAFGVSMLVICCSLGDVPIVKSSLSWFPWVPLSRLSYGLYLTHGVLITQLTFSARNPVTTDLPGVLVQLSGIIMWGTLAALLIWLLAEAPINNLVTAFLKPRNRISQSPKQSDWAEEVKDSKIHTIIVHAKSEHPQDKFNSSICTISSKI